jgi:hypothetical protein
MQFAFNECNLKQHNANYFTKIRSKILGACFWGGWFSDLQIFNPKHSVEKSTDCDISVCKDFQDSFLINPNKHYIGITRIKPGSSPFSKASTV